MIKYGNLEIPIKEKKERGIKNQIVLTRKDNTITIKIFLSNEVCHGSSKPLVSITNQLTRKYDPVSYHAKDFMKKDLTMIRILTFNF